MTDDPNRPMPHLRGLISERGASLRQLCMAAGADYNRLSYHVKPATRLDGIPGMDLLKEWARVLTLDVGEVFEAYALDLGYPLRRPDDDLDPDERDLLRNYRRMTPDDKVTFQRVGQSLTGGDSRR